MNEPTTSGMPPSVEGIVTRPSPFSVEETLERLQEAIHSRNLSLFAHIDHSGEAKHVGLTMQEAHVLIFGSPKGGTPLMIASPLLALDLPLKVLVWQSEGESGLGEFYQRRLPERSLCSPTGIGRQYCRN